MKPKSRVMWLVRVFGFNTVLLVAMTVFTTWLLAPPRLPGMTRILSLIGSAYTIVATFILWRMAKRAEREDRE